MKNQNSQYWIIATVITTGIGLVLLAPAGVKSIQQSMAKMKIKDFLKQYYPDAAKSQQQTGVPALVTLAQAALETGWGKYAHGNNFFGIKADKSWSGKKQLLKTTEILPSGRSFPEVISTTPTGKKNSKGVDLFKYIIRDYFRVYDDPAQSFNDRGQFFLKNPRYKIALTKSDPKEFATEIAKAGYATDPDYAKKLHSLIDGFQSLINEGALSGIDNCSDNSESCC